MPIKQGFCTVSAYCSLRKRYGRYGVVEGERLTSLSPPSVLTFDEDTD
jgi:hypothetical protein